MDTLRTLRQAAVKAAEKFTAARDELVSAESAYNRALNSAACDRLRTEGLAHPINFSNTVVADR